MIDVTVDSSGVLAVLSGVRERVRGAVARAVSAAALDLVGYIKKSKLHGGTPLFARSGNLSRAVMALPLEQTADGVVAHVVVDRTAPYGRFQEYGVDHPWKIRPREKKMLRFSVGGKIVFAKEVMHPGLKERSFMRSGLEDRRQAIIERIRAAVSEGIR